MSAGLGFIRLPDLKDEIHQKQNTIWKWQWQLINVALLLSKLINGFEYHSDQQISYIQNSFDLPHHCKGHLGSANFWGVILGSATSKRLKNTALDSKLLWNYVNLIIKCFMKMNAFVVWVFCS
jgi:hypothetical protein